MDLVEQIKNDLTSALKESETEQAQVLRLLVNALKQAHIKKGKKEEFSKQEQIEVLQKEAKKRKQSIQAYKKAGRNKLAKKEKAELEIIKKYLPKPLPEEKLEEIIQQAITETGAQGPQDIGRIMGKVMPQVKGRAEGAQVKQIVQDKLA